MRLFRARRRAFAIDPVLAARVRESEIFDPEWYVSRYPEVAAFAPGPLAHFLEYGLPEGRDPGPNFSVRNYLARVPDAAGTGPAVLHAIAGDWRRGIADDLDTFKYLLRRSGLFDAPWYLERYPDVARAGVDPFDHYAESGSIELREPGPAFDTVHYVETYPRYEDHFRRPVEHFLRLGRALGCLPTPPPEYGRWIASYDTLRPEDVERIRADPAGASLPPVVVLRVGPDLEGDARAANGASIGVRCETRIVRTGDDAQTALADVGPGTILLLVGGGALLRPHAAYLFATSLVGTDAQAAYSDHDQIDADGERAAPIFKPTFSPEFLRATAYVGPVVAVRLGPENRERVGDALARALAEEPSGATGGDRTARIWADLLLATLPGLVARIPFVLYHLPDRGAPDRGAIGPVSSRTSATSLEPVRDARAVPHPDPDLERGGAPLPSVRIVVPTRDRGDLLRECVDSILARTDYPRSRYEVVVVDNDSRDEATLAYLAAARARGEIALVAAPGRFNFSRVCNAGAAGATAEILVFLNNDTTVREPRWLHRLVAFARQPEYGAVGPRLLFPDDTVQHGGIVLGIQGVGAHRLTNRSEAAVREGDATREMAAVTGACLAIRREVFERLGGFDPILRVAFNDVQLCARTLAAGYRNVYVAEPLLYHHESKSRGLDDTREKQARNVREAAYVRMQFPRLFQDDPWYSPNLSHDEIGRFAFPPRTVPPWRRSPAGRRRILLLSRALGFGQGVAIVLGLQAAFLRGRGWEVIVGGPRGEGDLDFPGCARVDLWNARAAASYAIHEGVDCVVAHSPPFFSITRLIGHEPPVFFVDHGEPPPSLFPDRAGREHIDLEKRLCASLATGVFAISHAVEKQQYRRDAIVIRNGNAHLGRWSQDWAERRGGLRTAHALDDGGRDRFVVLNVCRFLAAERYYKGVDQYIDVMSEFAFLHPEIADHVVFVLAGRGTNEDVAYVADTGVRVFADASDATIAELYAASDLYVSLSQWEGYNLGVGHALAMGLEVVASDIDAHREFGTQGASGVEVSSSTVEICASIARRYEAWRRERPERRPVIESWSAPLARFAHILEAHHERHSRDRGA